MADTKLYERAFLTGADKNTEWMLPWFFDNYLEHNTYPIVFADFGVENIDIIKPYVHAVINMTNEPEQGWFKKPKSMIKCPAKRTVWIDSDCEILGNIEDIFDRIVPNKLAMVQDKPWSKRLNMEMYNSGIVGFVDKPYILWQWAKQVKENPQRGDQETLAAMLKDPLQTLTYIEPLPNIYNWLRLQLENDRQDSPHKRIVHWTGPKGKERIKAKMNA